MDKRALSEEEDQKQKEIVEIFKEQFLYRMSAQQQRKILDSLSDEVIRIRREKLTELTKAQEIIQEEINILTHE